MITTAITPTPPTLPALVDPRTLRRSSILPLCRRPRHSITHAPSNRHWGAEYRQYAATQSECAPSPLDPLTPPMAKERSLAGDDHVSTFV